MTSELKISIAVGNREPVRAGYSRLRTSLRVMQVSSCPLLFIGRGGLKGQTASSSGVGSSFAMPGRATHDVNTAHGTADAPRDERRDAT
eukprot:3620889-Rhodomonas_salina.2